MIRILLCGEGQHESGEFVWSPEEGEFQPTPGWMQIIIEKIVSARVIFAVKRRHDLILLPKNKKRFQPLPTGHGAKALMTKLLAEQEGYDIAIFMADADSNRRAEQSGVVNEIREGFERLPGSVECIPCVPMSASECWLMADDNAWMTMGLDDTRLLPRRPEQIWGSRDDPTGNHPHRYFNRLCNRAGVSDNLETRVTIAKGTSIDSLRAKCPVSFTDFACELADAANQKPECKCGGSCCV